MWIGRICLRVVPTRMKLGFHNRWVCLGQLSVCQLFKTYVL